MATILYNNRPATRPARAFNTVLNELLRDTLPTVTEPAKSFIPPADVLESEDGFELHLALPGVAKEAVQIDFQEGKLIISGERKALKSPEAKNGELQNAPRVRRLETNYGTFSRTFRLPDTIDVTAIEAEMTDGILRVRLPFDGKKVNKHHIEVR
ncbi:heat shock protein Hsp20 [Hymenobacter roseosalivarius DSM 11622]|uniref:Heat shock protein Hsp20 n=1 Tax=Hymenobacter roseosalivarius DSM 11622 TaxID=645990 RepID=A0A1W1VUA7_9BACT|nr:Hsp20/alpha crystallin family protein [Hymenobacter roseosalivarius]SMB96474.1 heat shock protein Hsp20 [Hymenobacter roseosalivarius DSM 11622]